MTYLLSANATKPRKYECKHYVAFEGSFDTEATNWVEIKSHPTRKIEPNSFEASERHCPTLSLT